jgi:hypothetical protein
MMILDLRTYTVKPSRMPAFLDLYRTHAWPLQQQYLGQCLGWYTVAEGPLNRVVHMWRYDSQADREARRGAMVQDPAWQNFLAVSEQAAHLLDMRNVILAPTPFSPQQ